MPPLEGAQRPVGVEGLPGEDAGRDEAAGGLVAIVHVADQLGRKVGGAQRIDPDDARAAQVAARVAIGNAPVVDIFGTEDDVAPATGEPGAERKVQSIALAVAARRDAGLGAEREALQILFEQDIDDARDGEPRTRPPSVQ